jgi:drug/metabolite transporter (DMT)-like permease
MRKEKWIYPFLACFYLVCVLFGYLNYVYMQGFPDGYISPYHLQMITLYRYSAAVLTLICVGLLFVKQRKMRRVLGVCGVILLGLFLGLDHYFYENMDHGQGG